MTKAAAVMECGGEKNYFCIFSILMFGKEAVCPDGLFVPAVFREVHFYLNSLTYIVCDVLSIYYEFKAVISLENIQIRRYA